MVANFVPPTNPTVRSSRAGKRHSTQKIEFGDFQTPVELAERCAEVARNELGDFSTVVEPTCGEGAFVMAAAGTFTSATILGFEVNPEYSRAAAARSNKLGNVAIAQANFFAQDWAAQRDQWDGPVLYLGNPPWVTNSQLGSLSAGNLPRKSNVGKVRGIDALTGRSNFDIAESILQALIETMRAGDALAMLVKSATVRRSLTGPVSTVFETTSSESSPVKTWCFARTA